MTIQDRFDDMVAERLRADAPRGAPPGLMDATLSRIDATPQPRRGWWGGTLPRLLAAAAVIALAVLLGTQLPGLLNRPVGTDASPSASASPSLEPSPSPSAAPSVSATPTPTSTPGSAVGPDETLLSLVRRCDVLPPIVGPHTTVLGDGRVIWPRQISPEAIPSLSVRRLNDDGLTRLIDEITGSGLFTTDAMYQHKRRAGTPEPPGHGGCVYDFDWMGAPDAVHVTSSMWFGDEEEGTYYEPAPERKALDAIAQHLVDPEAWFTSDEWVDSEAVAFEPPSYLVVVRVIPGSTLATEGAPDVDAISWPFAEPPDAFGDEFADGARCAVAEAAAVQTLAAELALAGMEQFDHPADGPSISLPWSARNAVVELTLYAQRPDGEPPCGGSLPPNG